MTNVSNSIIMVFMINVGTHIRDARERASMTQQELATCCGVSRAAVAQWENGIYLLKIRRAIAAHRYCFARLFGFGTAGRTENCKTLAVLAKASGAGA